MILSSNILANMYHDRYENEKNQFQTNSNPTDEIIELSNEIIKNETDALTMLSPKYWCHEISNKVFSFFYGRFLLQTIM